MPDILLLVPGFQSGAYQKHKKQFATEPPAKARFIASYLYRRNIGVEVWDSNVMEQSADDLADAVVSAHPKIVVVPVYGLNPSSSTQTMPSARWYARAIKSLNPAIPIIFSGTHPAALPERTLREEPIDYVCRGEGPITIHELLQAIDAGAGIEKVRGLTRWENGAVVHNASAPLIDLSLEPALAGWQFIDPRNYYAHNWHTFYADPADRSPYANPYSEEGCPFHCSFCNIQSPYRDGESLLPVVGSHHPNSYRKVSPQQFVSEVSFLVEHFGVKHFKVPDEMFVLHKSHVLQIAAGIKERFGDALNFWVYARVDTCKLDLIEALRPAGFRWVCLGIEAADSKVRDGQDKGFNDESIHEVVQRIQANGVCVAANFIFGLRHETQETMEKTFTLARELNTPFANFYCAQALPGSELYKDAVRDGYPLPDRPGGPGWAGYAQYSYDCEPYYPGSALTPADILSFRDEKHLVYYTRPEYRSMMANDPRFGERALRNIDEWMDSMATMRRRIIDQSVAV